MKMARWRDSEIARRKERDSEIDYFTKRKREKEKETRSWNFCTGARCSAE